MSTLYRTEKQKEGVARSVGSMRYLRTWFRRTLKRKRKGKKKKPAPEVR